MKQTFFPQVPQWVITGNRFSLLLPRAFTLRLIRLHLNDVLLRVRVSDPINDARFDVGIPVDVTSHIVRPPVYSNSTPRQARVDLSRSADHNQTSSKNRFPHAQCHHLRSPPPQLVDWRISSLFECLATLHSLFRPMIPRMDSILLASPIRAGLCALSSTAVPMGEKDRSGGGGIALPLAALRLERMPAVIPLVHAIH